MGLQEEMLAVEATAAALATEAVGWVAAVQGEVVTMVGSQVAVMAAEARALVGVAAAKMVEAAGATEETSVEEESA